VRRGDQKRKHLNEVGRRATGVGTDKHTIPAHQSDAIARDETDSLLRVCRTLWQRSWPLASSLHGFESVCLVEPRSVRHTMAVAAQSHLALEAPHLSCECCTLDARHRLLFGHGRCGNCNQIVCDCSCVRCVCGVVVLYFQVANDVSKAIYINEIHQGK